MECSRKSVSYSACWASRLSMSSDRPTFETTLNMSATGLTTMSSATSLKDQELTTTSREMKMISSRS